MASSAAQFRLMPASSSPAPPSMYSNAKRGPWRGAWRRRCAMVGNRRIRPVLFSSPLRNGGGAGAASCVALVRSSMGRFPALPATLSLRAKRSNLVPPARRLRVEVASSRYALLATTWLEVTIGRPGEFARPALRVEETCLAGTSHEAADLAEPDACGARRLAQGRDLARRNAGDDLEIVAAGEDR